MIRTFTLLSIMYVLPVLAHAQFETGQKVIGGNIGFSVGKDEAPYSYGYTSNFANIAVNPSFSKFRKPNLLKGIELSYSYQYWKSKSTQTTDVSRRYNNSIGISCFAQRFFPLTGKLFFTMKTTVGVGYQFGTDFTTTNSVENKTKNTGFGGGLTVAPGLSYRLSNRFLFDAYLSNLLYLTYSHLEMKSGQSTRVSNKVDLSSGLSNTNLGNVGLGFRWLLAKK